MILKALQCAHSGPPPIWIFRQSGRYLPNYRALKEKYSLRQLFLEPELSAQATLLPFEYFPLDAAILFSDITLPAIALGCTLDFQEGPVITPLLTPESILRIVPYDPRIVLASVGQAIRYAKERLHVPLFGFCAEPFTLATYLIESHKDPTLHQTKRWLHSDPTSFHLLLRKITDVTKLYLEMQIHAGIDAIQIFDSSSHILSDEDWREFSVPYLAELLPKKSIPSLIFSRNAALRVGQSELNPTGWSVDWLTPMSYFRKKMGPHVALQGNLDPDLLFAPLPLLQSRVEALLHSMRKDPGFIVNLGHGIKPQTPLAAVHCLIKTVKDMTAP